MKFFLFSLLMCLSTSHSFASLADDRELFQTSKMSVTFWNAHKDTRTWTDMENADSELSFIRLADTLEQHPWPSVQDIANFIQDQQDLLKAQHEKGDGRQILPCPCVLAVRGRQNDDLFGFIKLKTTPVNGVISFGWALAPQWRGQGMGSELLAGLIDYLRTFMGLESPLVESIIADVEITNPPSLKALSKYMQPYNIKDICIGPMSFAVVQFRYPPEELGQPISSVERLTSKEAKTRHLAIQEIWDMDGFKGKFRPVYNRYFIETFYRYYRLNAFANQRGIL